MIKLIQDLGVFWKKDILIWSSFWLGEGVTQSSLHMLINENIIKGFTFKHTVVTLFSKLGVHFWLLHDSKGLFFKPQIQFFGKRGALWTSDH